ncbi:unnamed protein product, partial [Allacma fusca]
LGIVFELAGFDIRAVRKIIAQLL